MKTDRYLKAVLTVIALCLVALCVRSVAPAVAQDDGRPVRVQIVGIGPERASRFGPPPWEPIVVKTGYLESLSVRTDGLNQLAVRIER